MLDIGVSPYASFLSSLTKALIEANESAFFESQKALPGDRASMRQIEQQEEKQQIQRLEHQTPNTPISETLDILA